MSEHQDVIAEIERMFIEEGAQEYLGEEVSMATHMLQTAAFAEADGAEAELVVAALLHDVGHFTGTISGRELMAGTDNEHSDQGAAWLSTAFPPEVTEPIRLHVPAKRYLCTVDPAYFSRLSPASVHTLELQGGRMSDAEVEAYEAEPFAQAGVQVRRYDDAGKDPDMVTPPLEHYRPVMERCVRR